MLKNKKGIAIEWAIVFALVIFGLIASLISYMTVIRVDRQYSQKMESRQTDLEQLCEYYIRCCGKSGEFPKGNETTYDKFGWMDENAVDFFKRIQSQYGYTFQSETQKKLNSFWKFYTDSSIARKLTVSKDGTEFMTMIVEEYIEYDTKNPLIMTYSNNGASTYRILDWSIRDIDEEFESDSLGLLGSIWKWIGGGISKLVVRTENSDYYMITYNTAQGTITTSAQSRVEKKHSFTLPGVKKDGNHFDGWSDGNNVYQIGDTVTPKKNMTFTATWTPYRVTYNAGGGSSAPATVFGVVDSLPTATHSDPAKKLIGWKEQGAEDGTAIMAGKKFVPTKDTVLVAVWETLPTYPVRYEKGDATGGSTPTEQTKVEGKALTLYGNTGNLTKNTDSVQSGDCTVTFQANGSGAVCQPSSSTVKIFKYTEYAFDGWTDAGGKMYAAGESYTQNCALTLKPHFAETEMCAAKLTLPTPSWEGHDFLGWYTDSEGGTKVGSAGDEYATDRSVTLYAHWKLQTFTVTLEVTKGKASFNQNGKIADVPYGATFITNGKTIKFTYPDDSTKSFSASVDFSEFESAWSPSSGTVKSEMTISVEFTDTSSCIVPGTLITLADGSRVPVEQLRGDELLLVWNLETGNFDAAPMVFVDYDPEAICKVISLTFSDGTTVEIISEHGFFEADLAEYVYLTADNAAEWIGHRFVKSDDPTEKQTTVLLTDVRIETRVTEAYSPVTAKHLCYYVNGLLSMPGGIEGLFNLFAVDAETMKYDADGMTQDIETFGLLSFADFGDLITEEMFEAFNGKYLQIAIEKGLLSWEDIERLATRYKPIIETLP